MPLSATHILSGVFLVEIWKHFSVKKRYFTPFLFIFAGFFALLPDSDFFFDAAAYVFNFDLIYWLHHGGVMHTPFFVLLFLIPGFIFWKLRKYKPSIYLYVAGFSISIHLILDWFLGGGSAYGMMLLFPFSSERSLIHLIEPYKDLYSFELLDGLLLFIWLWYVKFKK